MWPPVSTFFESAPAVNTAENEGNCVWKLGLDTNGTWRCGRNAANIRKQGAQHTKRHTKTMSSRHALYVLPIRLFHPRSATSATAFLQNARHATRKITRQGKLYCFLTSSLEAFPTVVLSLSLSLFVCQGQNVNLTKRRTLYMVR